MLGSEHPNTFPSMSNLTLVLGRQNKYKETEVVNRQMPVQRKVLEPEHPEKLLNVYCLANLLA